MQHLDCIAVNRGLRVSVSKPKGLKVCDMGKVRAARPTIQPCACCQAWATPYATSVTQHNELFCATLFAQRPAHVDGLRTHASRGRLACLGTIWLTLNGVFAVICPGFAAPDGLQKLQTTAKELICARTGLLAVNATHLSVRCAFSKHL